MTVDKDFKVVRILDEYRIIINAGSLHNVTEDDYFEIHGAIDKVYDPETNELLGTIDGIKGEVRPVKIDEKLCICKNREVFSPIGQKITTDIMASILVMNNLMGTPKKLNVDKSQISNPEIYEPIQIGDKAVLKKVIKAPKDDSPEKSDT